MDTILKNKMEIELSGQVERITFTNEENGYTIARVKIYGRHDLVTVVGYLMSPAPGEILKMRGEWINHPKFGERLGTHQRPGADYRIPHC